MMNFYSLLVNMTNLKKAFEIMWKGCLAIAIVIALVIAVTIIVNAICVKIENSKKDGE